VESIAGVCREQKINIVCIGRPEFSLFSLLKSAIRLRRLTVRLSRMNIDLFIFS
jgi:two-component system, OmpR family, sensor histidine kinase KdpD